jgi:hypothetical protein
MDIDRARDLLANLLERARSSTDKTFLTGREIDALGALLAGEASEPTAKPKKASGASSQTHSRSLTLAPCIVTEDQIDSRTMLCIDFGTSFSKAFVSIDNGYNDPDLVELPLSDGTTGTQLAAPSELLIDGDTILFGVYARRRWYEIQAPRERLIDSIKQFITLNKEVAALNQRSMPTSQDPGQHFSQRDILVLYLAHLTALTEKAILEKGLGTNIKRRFTHPAWKDGVKEQNEREMRRLMAEAVVLARSAATEFASKMPLASARQFLDQLMSLEEDKLPFVLIGDPVREATAAGAGALLATREGKRESYLVLDIGAGTTDVAGFYCVNNPLNERMRVFENSSAADARNVAGNTLDDALQRFVLDLSGLSQDSAEARLAGHALRRQIRSYKEQLFRSERVIVDLNTDQTIEVALTKFLAYPPVIQFTRMITEMVAGAAIALAGDLSRVKLVATGGGARLPIVQELAEKGVRHGDKHVSFELIDAIADGIRQTHPDLIDPYPQIAVALGGSLPHLPEQRKSVLTAPGASTAPKVKAAPAIYKS